MSPHTCQITVAELPIYSLTAVVITVFVATALAGYGAGHCPVGAVGFCEDGRVDAEAVAVIRQLQALEILKGPHASTVAMAGGAVLVLANS